MKKSNWKIVTLTNGFFILGRFGTSDNEGWVFLESAAVSGGYTGGKGIGGVASGEDQTVNWDPCPNGMEIPIDKIIFIIDCVDDKVKLTDRNGNKMV